MSLFTLAQRNETYLTAAVQDYLQKLGTTAGDDGDAHREAEFLVAEILSGLELHVSSLEALHEAAAAIEAVEWERQEGQLLNGLRDLLTAGKELVSRLPPELPGVEQLQRRMTQIDFETFWEVSDYAESPKLEAMVRESQRAYRAGEWEAGGWNE